MKNKISQEEQEQLISILKVRFEKNKNRHVTIEWSKVEAKLVSSPEKLWSLLQMEKTEGEPDVVGYDKNSDEYIFLIALPKVRNHEEAFVTIEKLWIQEKNTNQKTVPLIWPKKWESNF